MIYTGGDMTPDKNAESTLINPYYVITLNDGLFLDHEIEGAKEDWVLKNVQLINEIGSTDWLNELLSALSGEAASDHVRDTLISPYKGIIFSPRLQGEHEPIIDRQQWIQANAKLMKELGAEAWLWQLLDVLETGGPVAEK